MLVLMENVRTGQRKEVPVGGAHPSLDDWVGKGWHPAAPGAPFPGDPVEHHGPERPQEGSATTAIEPG